jgi:putative phosphoribosyl transferase
MDAFPDTLLFRDRHDAGRQLVEHLMRYKDENPVVLALPRGGVAVGYEIARALGAPLDVIVARKIGAPFQPEFGIGAIAPGGVRVIDERSVRALGISPDELEEITARESEEMTRRIQEYRGLDASGSMPDVRDRTVILVDDGLATGVTARAAIMAIKQERPRRLVLAMPVCAPQTAEALRAEVNEVVCLALPEDFRAVGLWYENFEQLTDEQVIELLRRARRESQTQPVKTSLHDDNAAMAAAAGQIKGVSMSRTSINHNVAEETVRVTTGSVVLEGDLGMPEDATGVVLFAHGSGSSRLSPRNRYVADVLRERGLATLLLDLLTRAEELAESQTGHLRFDIEMLAERLGGATDWLATHPAAARLPIGYFGASTGAAAALVAAAERPERVAAVVSRGGRPDLAGAALRRVRAPTLLIVGGNDTAVIALNEVALEQLAAAEKQLEIVPGASHLFEEPGALEQVAQLAAGWFACFLPQQSARRGGQRVRT